MVELGLGRASTPWHVARDGFAEAVSLLGLVTGTLAKIATDVMLLMQTEVGEAFEPFVQGRGSSSTMPQKRNPISCEFIVAAARIVRQHAGLMLGRACQQITSAPRAPGSSSGRPYRKRSSPRRARCGRRASCWRGLIVDAGRMRRNLDLTAA
jgi:3-carboxy-cis,cis-muconate cycloisomerase